MALLIDIKQPGWMEDEELQEDLVKFYPGADIRCSAAPGNLDEIEMLAVSNYNTGEALRYPNLKLIQKIGAGGESICSTGKSGLAYDGQLTAAPPFGSPLAAKRAQYDIASSVMPRSVAVVLIHASCVPKV